MKGFFRIGASRYRAPQAPSAPAAPVASSDPWTGASRYSGSPAPAPPATTQSTSTTALPVVRQVEGIDSRIVVLTGRFLQANPISFQQANVPAMQAKFYQFDQELRNEIVCTVLLNFFTLQNADSFSRTHLVDVFGWDVQSRT